MRSFKNCEMPFLSITRIAKNPDNEKNEDKKLKEPCPDQDQGNNALLFRSSSLDLVTAE